MIRTVTKNEYFEFQKELVNESLFMASISMMDIFDDFIEEDMEDDEIDVKGYFDENGNLLGIIRYSTENVEYVFDDVESDEKVTLIGALLVHPNYRNKKIGKELVIYAIQDSEQEIVVADPFDENATRFFGSIGFLQESEVGYLNDGWTMHIHKNEMNAGFEMKWLHGTGPKKGGKNSF